MTPRNTATGSDVEGDPLLSRLRTRIVSCQPASLTTAPPQGKAKKKGYKLDTPSEAATPTGTLWEVQTEDTVVFPEGEPIMHQSQGHC